MKETYDAIVIGAGIMGCATAYELAQRGMQVAILEKGNIGDGGTGKSSAIIRQHYSNELTARMALHSLRVFQNFDETIGGEAGFTETGFLALVEAKDHRGLEANVALQRRVGIHSELLGPEAVRELMPGIETADLVAAAYEPEAGYADPYLTVTAYANAARRLGVGIYQDTAVTGLRFAGGNVKGIDSAKGGFDAPVVINCAGAWGAPVGALAGLNLPINSCRVQVAFLRRPEGEEAPHPVVVDFIHATYFRAETGNLTLMGIVDPSEAEAVVDPDDYEEGMDDAFLLQTGEQLVLRYPALERAESRGGYASLYGITPDWHPIVDEVPVGSGFFVCAGFSGHGFKLGPAVGVMVADLVTGRSDPLFDPHMFRLSRFAEHDEVRGQYEYSIAG
jgi:sarcosine oxidase subunit beta